MVKRREQWVQRISVLMSFAAAACDGDGRPSPTSAGVSLEGGSSTVGSAGTDGAAASAGTCPAGVAVVATDYQSSNVSILSPAGAVLAESILSSGSTNPGLSNVLSSDVVLPRVAPASGRLVIVDRGNAVISWLDPSTARVTHQLQVGFNPHDYLDLPGAKAYVTRYNSNPAPGASAHDSGGDVLVIDTATYSVRGSLSLVLPGDGAFSPNPDRMLQVGTDVWVLLQRFTRDFATAADARVAILSSADDTLAFSVDLPGVANCGGIARSPDGNKVALSCTGAYDGTEANDRSAVVLLDASVRPPVVTRVLPASTTLQPPAPFGFSIAFVAPDRLIVGNMGRNAPQRNDALLTLSLADHTASPIFEAAEPFALGEIFCNLGCTDLCFVATAGGSTDAISVWKTADGSLAPQTPIEVDPTLKLRLPPRWLSPLGG